MAAKTSNRVQIPFLEHQGGDSGSCRLHVINNVLGKPVVSRQK